MFNNLFQVSFIAINYKNYNDNFIFYKSSFSSFITSLKLFAIFTSLFNSSIIFIINLINVIFFNIINLIISLFRAFIIVDVIKIKRVDVILKKKFDSNKKIYIKDEKLNSFSRK